MQLLFRISVLALAFALYTNLHLQHIRIITTQPPNRIQLTSVCPLDPQLIRLLELARHLHKRSARPISTADSSATGQRVLCPGAQHSLPGVNSQPRYPLLLPSNNLCAPTTAYRSVLKSRKGYSIARIRPDSPACIMHIAAWALPRQAGSTNCSIRCARSSIVRQTEAPSLSSRVSLRVCHVLRTVRVDNSAAITGSYQIRISLTYACNSVRSDARDGNGAAKDLQP